jgi:PAS domain S-box-containing protein
MRRFRGAWAQLRAGMNDAVAPIWLNGRRLRAEREAERIFELSPALLAVVGFDGYLRRFNPAFEVLGYSGEELLSRKWIEFAHPNDRERMLQAAASLARGVNVVEVDNRIVCRDGSLRWVVWSTRVVPEEGLFYAAGRDVTESRHAAEEQAALRRVATLVARESAPDSVFAAVVREVGELLGVDATHIGRYDADGTVVSVAQWGNYPGVPIGARFPLEGDSVSARVLRTGRPARIDDYEEAPGVIAATIRQLGIRFSIGVPISVEGRPWGVIIATSKGPSPFPAETESRLQNFTELVATAIANADARTELTASRARIVAVSDDARRRIERDLHDGTQQRLVSLRLAVRAMERASLKTGTTSARSSTALRRDSRRRSRKCKSFPEESTQRSFGRGASARPSTRSHGVRQYPSKSRCISRASRRRQRKSPPTTSSRRPSRTSLSTVGHLLCK